MNHQDTKLEPGRMPGARWMVGLMWMLALPVFGAGSVTPAGVNIYSNSTFKGAASQIVISNAGAVNFAGGRVVIDVGVGGTSSSGTNFANVNSTNDVKGSSFTLSGTGSPQQTLGAGSTNWNMKLGNSTVIYTNVVGLKEQAAASVVELDMNTINDLSITNRISAATTIVVTNGADGQRYNIVLIGEASGGTDRTVTVVPHTGQLAASLDNFGTALAVNFAVIVTNGYAAEISGQIRRQRGTNTHGLVSRLSKF